MVIYGLPYSQTLNTLEILSKQYTDLSVAHGFCDPHTDNFGVKRAYLYLERSTALKHLGAKALKNAVEKGELIVKFR